MLRILLCDDNADELLEIETMIHSYFSERDCKVKIFTLCKPSEALSFIANNTVDAVILDIVMPEMTGVVLAEELRNLGYGGVIAFLTNSNDFASESYDVGARAYLRKPVSFGKLIKLLESLEQPDKTQNYITVARRGSTRVLDVAELMYVEVIRNHLYFHMSDGDTIEAYAPLKEYAGTLLKHNCMAQCHVSFVVNMDFIHTLERGLIRLKNGTQLPVSRSQQEFRDKCLAWLFGKEKA